MKCKIRLMAMLVLLVVLTGWSQSTSAQCAITKEPADDTACFGGVTPRFTVITSGSSLSYQWQIDTGAGFTDITDTFQYLDINTPTLTMAGTTLEMSGYKYRCVITGVSCATTLYSRAAKLTIIPTSMDTHPVNDSVCVGDSVVFTATIAKAIAFQWYEDTGTGYHIAPYSSAYSSRLVIPSVTSALNGARYYCASTGYGICGIALSKVAVLTVKPGAVITIQPKDSVFLCPAAITTISIGVSGTGATFRWQDSSAAGWTNITDVPGVYSGAATSSLWANLSLGYGAKKRFRCLVSSACGTAISRTASMSSVPMPSITSYPSAVTVCAGDTADFSITASGALTYQWGMYKGTSLGITLSDTPPFSGTKTNHLTISNVPDSLDGYTFYCSVNSCWWAGSAGLTVNPGPAITAHPENDSVCIGALASFSVKTGTKGLSYQWQADTGSGVFVNVSATWPKSSFGTYSTSYSGMTSDSLSITYPGRTLDGVTFRCLVSSSCGTTASKSAVLHIYPDKVFTHHPSNVTVCAGGTATFSITAIAGSGIYRYQWVHATPKGLIMLKDSGMYSGTTTSTLTITGVTPALDGAEYFCFAIDKCYGLGSNKAKLKVTTGAVITVEPGNDTACIWGTASFTTAVSGTGPGTVTYTWMIDTGGGYKTIPALAPYSGVNTATLSISKTTGVMDGYKYRCTVTTGCGTVYTRDAVLYIPKFPVLTTAPDVTICEGGTASFTAIVTGMPSGTLYSHPTYSWLAVTPSGSTFTVMNGGVYSGATTPTLTITAATAAMDGYKYVCYLHTPCGTTLTMRSTLNVKPGAVVITRHPSDTTMCEFYSAVKFSVAATGSGLSYKWQADTGSGVYTDVTAKWPSGGSTSPAYSGMNTDVLTITGHVPALTGYKYRCLITSACGTTASKAGILTVTPMTRVTRPDNDTTCVGGTASFTVTATGTGTLTYQWMAITIAGYIKLSASTIYSGVNSPTLTVTGVPSSLNGVKYYCIVTGKCYTTAGMFATLTVTSSKILPVTVQPANDTVCIGDTAIFSTHIATATGYTYTWYEKFPSGGYHVVPDTFPYIGARTPVLKIAGTTAGYNGAKYYCIASNACGAVTATTEARLTVRSSSAIIFRHPASASVCLGTGTSFSVIVRGSGLSYQWQVDTGRGFTDIKHPMYTGVNTGTLMIWGSTMKMNGYRYRCVIRSCGSLYSEAATLTVYEGGTITSHPSDQTVCAGHTATFSVSIPGAAYYVWYENTGSGFRLVSYPGVYTSSLTIKGVDLSLNGAQYYCAASGPGICGILYTKVATLTVVNCTITPADTPIYSAFPLTTGGGSGGNGWNIASASTGEILNEEKDQYPLSLYPNPLTGSELSIRTEAFAAKNTTIKITDRFGRIAYTSETVFDEKGLIVINADQLPPGVYTIQVFDKTTDAVKTTRFIKQ